MCAAGSDGSAECVCAGPEFCEGHSKQVCGTDGVLYPSHCELHRTACIKGSHIGIDHDDLHCQKPILQGMYTYVCQIKLCSIRTNMLKPNIMT